MVASICIAAILATSPAVAQDPQEPPANPAVAADGQNSTPVKTKKKKKDLAGSTAKKEKEKEEGADSAPAAKPPKHPSWRIGNIAKLDFKTRIETEMRTPTPAMGFDSGQIDWQDRRLGVEGTLLKRITFEVSRELSQDFEASHDLSEKTAWKDVYVNFRVSKRLNVEAGRFKLPFGREELTSEPSLDFAHRSFAARVLSPGRDVGVMAHGRLFGRAVSYQAGYFTRDGDNGRTSQTRGGEDAVAGRVVITPFVVVPGSVLAPLEIGLSTATSRNDNRLGLRGRTVLGDGIFFDRVYVNGQRQRVGLDAQWASGPVSLATEYTRLTDERNAMGFGGADLPNIGATAWYVAGTWALTGERKRGRLEPAHDLLRGGYGAVEVAARIEALRFSTADYSGAPVAVALNLFANSDRATTVGINWYLNHYLKLVADVVMESVDDAERSPAPTAGGRFTSTVFLLQFRF